MFTLWALWTLSNIGVQERGYLIYPFRNSKENRQTMLIHTMHSLLSIMNTVVEENRRISIVCQQMTAKRKKSFTKTNFNSIFAKSKQNYNLVLHCVNLENSSKIWSLLDIINGNWNKNGFCNSKMEKINCYNSFQSSFGFHIETSHLIRNANRATGLYMKRNTGLNWANIRTFVDKSLLGWCLCWLRKFLVSRKFFFTDVWNTYILNSWLCRNLFS